MSTLDSAINPQEQTSQGKGWIVSLITHILVIIALFLPMIVNKTPPPEEEGLLVNLGLLDEGQGEETPKELIMKSLLSLKKGRKRSR